MISDVWDRTTSLFDRRFVTNALLPVLLLLPAVVMTIWFGTGSVGDVFSLINATDTTTKLTALLGYFLAAWFFAAFVQSQWRNFVRLYEGYPLRFFPRAHDWGVRSHQDRLARAQNMGLGHVQYYRYPLNKQDVMPTSLGNVLRAAERYPHDRYGADSILMWPRLAPLVPVGFSAQVDEFRGAMEFLIVASTWCGLFASASAVGLLILGGSPLVFLAVLSIGFGMAWFAYRGAVEAAVEYGEQLRVGHDLYRFRLLRQFRMPQPANLDEEKRQWDLLGDFIFSNFVEALTYESGESAPTPSEDVEAS